MLQNTVTLIFDFDGTIAATLDLLVSIANALAPEFGYEPLTAEQVEEFRNSNSYEILRQVDISFWSLPRLIRCMRKEVAKHTAEIDPVYGMPETLRTLHHHGIRLGIVTSNSTQNVQAFLEAQQLTELFEFVLGKNTIFGKGRLIRRIIRQYNLEDSRILYVGDEVRDVEAARFAAVEAVSVTWGFNTASLLAAAKPNFLLNQPCELLQFSKAIATSHSGKL